MRRVEYVIARQRLRMLRVSFVQVSFHRSLFTYRRLPLRIQGVEYVIARRRLRMLRGDLEAALHDLVEAVLLRNEMGMDGNAAWQFASLCIGLFSPFISLFSHIYISFHSYKKLSISSRGGGCACCAAIYLHVGFSSLCIGLFSHI